MYSWKMASVIPNVVFVAIFFSESLLPSSSSIIYPRIYGGHIAGRTQIPYIVLIENGNEQLCAGTILNRQWIVTVAHCVANRKDNMKVYAGSIQDAEVQDVIIHPGYDDSSVDAIENDVALLRLATNLTFNDIVKPIQIMNEEELSDAVNSNSHGWISGWGHSKESSRSKILRTAEVVLLSDEECLHDIQPDCHAFNPEAHLCSGGSQAGVGLHDDGGPLVVNEKLAGIILHKEHEDSVETYHQSSIYARISYYTDFFSANNIFPEPTLKQPSDSGLCLLEIELTLELLSEANDYFSFFSRSYLFNYNLWFLGRRLESHDIETIDIYEETPHSKEYIDASDSEYYRIYTGERGEILPLNYEENQEESETKLRINSEDDDELLLVNSGRIILNIQVWSSSRRINGSIGFRVFPNSPIDSFILISARTE